MATFSFFSSHVIVFGAVIWMRLSSPNTLSLFTHSGNDASHTLQITARNTSGRLRLNSQRCHFIAVGAFDFQLFALFPSCSSKTCTLSTPIHMNGVNLSMLDLERSGTLSKMKPDLHTEAAGIRLVHHVAFSDWTCVDRWIDGWLLHFLNLKGNAATSHTFPIWHHWHVSSLAYLCKQIEGNAV